MASTSSLKGFPLWHDIHSRCQEGSEVHPGIQKLAVAHVAGSADSLWLGGASGELRRLDSSQRLSAACKIFEERLLGLSYAGRPEWLLDGSEPLWA